MQGMLVCSRRSKERTMVNDKFLQQPLTVCSFLFTTPFSTALAALLILYYQFSLNAIHNRRARAQVFFLPHSRLLHLQGLMQRLRWAQQRFSNSKPQKNKNTDGQRKKGPLPLIFQGSIFYPGGDMLCPQLNTDRLLKHKGGIIIIIGNRAGWKTDLASAQIFDFKAEEST